MSKKIITIEVDDDIDLFISDILCWLVGFLAGRNEEYSQNMNLLNPAIDKLRELKCKLRDELIKE